jgi:hypothetical protein
MAKKKEKESHSAHGKSEERFEESNRPALSG